jgi:hypothetical protein
MMTVLLVTVISTVGSSFSICLTSISKDGYMLVTSLCTDILTSEGSTVKLILLTVLMTVYLLLVYSIYMATDQESTIFDLKLGFFILALAGITEAYTLFLSLIL